MMQRVESALKHVKPEHLLLAPDCGLMTISRELAWAKIQRLAETAREIRKSL
jgi:5-methyltetrahydropteroyltriglutamate--homocysteine methyltransferase